MWMFMLSSSRALVHAPWRLVRSRITSNSTSKLPKSPHFSTGIARFPGLLSDCFEERVPVRNTSRNYATSPQSLRLLVQEEKYDEASTMFKEMRSRGVPVQPHPVFIKAVGHLLSQRVLGGEDHKLLLDWLELVPDLRVSKSAPTCLASFEYLLDDLRHHIKADPSLAFSISLVLVQKGYKALVDKEVYPFVKTSSGNDAFASLLQETSQSRSASKSMNPSEVFEDTSEDYHSIQATSTPPPPSILELVESSLPETLPPPGPIKEAVFEELDEDYVVLKSTSQSFPRRSSAEQLEQLIREKQFNFAYQLFSELLHLDIPIPFSHAYESAALDALRRPLSSDYTPEKQLKLFTAWLSLIPFEHEYKPFSRLQLIRSRLMLAQVTSLPLIMQFCTITAAKGYMELVEKQELAVVMRFAPTHHVSEFIERLESVYSAYWQSYQPENAAAQTTQFKSRLRSLCVRYLAFSGRVQEAITLVPEIESEIQLGHYTLEKLLRTIRDCNNPSFMQYAPRVQSLLDATEPSDGEKLRQLRNEAEGASIAAELRTLPANVDFGTLSKTLRQLKRVFRTGHNIPHPFVIANFLERYLATGRTRAPTYLLNVCLKSSFRSTSIFLFSEMLHYRRMGQPYLVIKTFVDHFYISGVPRDDVLDLYSKAERRLELPEDELRDNHYSRMCTFSPSQLPQGKIWPMKFHCNLVWHTLVTLSSSLAKLPDLYHKLLDHAEGLNTQFTSTRGSSVAPLRAPPSWGSQVDSASFTPFMREMMWISGPHRGYGIIKEMVKVGVRPTVYHYTEVAGYYARQGLDENALELLDYLEKGSGLMERLIREKKEGQRTHRGIPTFAHPVLTDGGMKYVSPSAPESSSSPTSSSPPNSPSSPASHSSPASTTFNTPNSESATPADLRPPEPDLVFYISLMRGFIVCKSTKSFQQVHKRLVEIRKYLPKRKFHKDQEEYLNEVYADFRAMCRSMGHDYKTERRIGYRTFMKHKG